MLQTIIVLTSNLLPYPWKQCCLIECVQFGRRVWRLDLERGANQNTASNRHSAIPMPLCPTPSYQRERERARERPVHWVHCNVKRKKKNCWNATHSCPFKQNKVICRKLQRTVLSKYIFSWANMIFHIFHFPLELEETLNVASVISVRRSWKLVGRC